MNIEDDIKQEANQDSESSLEKMLPKHIKETNDYMDDYELTKKLIQEVEEFKNGKRNKPSEELSEAFLTVFYRFISSWKYYRYTDDRKQDFLSQSSYLFVKNWMKFDPTKVQKNWRQKDKEKYLVPEEEYRGAFSFFTMICANGTHSIITKFKKEKEKKDALISDENEKARDTHYQMMSNEWML